jgi:hypothetical protein
MISFKSIFATETSNLALQQPTVHNYLWGEVCLLQRARRKGIYSFRRDIDFIYIKNFYLFIYGI